MLGLAGSIISPNKTAANQRADAFTSPRLDHLLKPISVTAIPPIHSISDRMTKCRSFTTPTKRTGVEGFRANVKTNRGHPPVPYSNPGVFAKHQIWKRHTDPTM